MTILLSIDGGNRISNDRVCYLAEFHRGELYDLHILNRAQAVKATELTCDAVAVERPTYLKSNVPPKVIFGLCWNAAAVAYTIARGSPVHEYTVNDGLDTDWIGTVAKPVLHRRIWSALTGPERKVFGADVGDLIEANSQRFARARRFAEHKAYNTLDAAGVGLFHLGRIGKGGKRI